MERTIRTPRQFSTCVYQFFGALILFVSILFLILTILSVTRWSTNDILIVSTLSLPPLILGGLILHFTQKYISRVTIDTEQGVLKINNKECADEIYTLNEINKFVFNLLVFPSPGFSTIKINAELDNGTNVNLISAEMVFSGKSWMRFSEKLAEITNKPLVKGTLIENYNGKLIPK